MLLTRGVDIMDRAAAATTTTTTTANCTQWNVRPLTLRARLPLHAAVWMRYSCTTVSPEMLMMT